MTDSERKAALRAIAREAGEHEAANAAHKAGLVSAHEAELMKRAATAAAQNAARALAAEKGN